MLSFTHLLFQAFDILLQAGQAARDRHFIYEEDSPHDHPSRKQILEILHGLSFPLDAGSRFRVSYSNRSASNSWRNFSSLYRSSRIMIITPITAITQSRRT